MAAIPRTPETKERGDDSEVERSPLVKLSNGMRARALWIDVLRAGELNTPVPTSLKVTSLVYKPGEVPYEYYKEAMMRVHYRRNAPAAERTLRDRSIRLLLGRFRGSTVWEQEANAKPWLTYVKACARKHMKPVRALVTWGGPGLLLVHAFHCPSGVARDSSLCIPVPAIDFLSGESIGYTKHEVVPLEAVSEVKARFRFIHWMTQTRERVATLKRWYKVDETKLRSREFATIGSALSGAGDDEDARPSARASTRRRPTRVRDSLTEPLLPKSQDSMDIA